MTGAHLIAGEPVTGGDSFASAPASGAPRDDPKRRPAHRPRGARRR